LLAHVVAAALGVFLVLVFGGDGDEAGFAPRQAFPDADGGVWPSVRLRELGAVQVPPAGGVVQQVVFGLAFAEGDDGFAAARGRCAGAR
jgi:hypothetical protein